MTRIVSRPRIQVPFLVVLFAVWTFVGVSYFTAGDVVAEQDWFGIALGVTLVITGIAGIWRAFRLGMVIDDTGIRVRNFDSRDDVISWNEVRAVECTQIDERAGVPLYGPVILFDNGSALALRSFGSYSKSGAQRKVATLRVFAAGADT